MERAKILVTGGAGFIGSHAVVELYEAGYQPVIVDDFSNSTESVLRGIQEILGGVGIPCHNIDCGNEDALRGVFSQEKDIRGIIHFAAFKAVGESVQKPLAYYHNNVGSLITMLRVMPEFGIKNFVFSSSCTVYGIPDQLPVTEQTPTKPATSPYGNTKKMCEDILTDVAKAGDTLRTILLRYFNPIGAHASAKIGELPLGVPQNLVPFITQTAAGVREKLTIYGNTYDTPDGTNIRDYIHVVDLAKAHVVAVQRLLDETGEKVEVFNVGTGRGNSVLEVVHAFENATGQKLNYAIGPPRPGDVPAIYADVTKATNELGFKTISTLEEALASAWKWQQTLAS